MSILSMLAITCANLNLSECFRLITELLRKVSNVLLLKNQYGYVSTWESPHSVSLIQPVCCSQKCITARTLQAVTLGQNYSRVAKHRSRRKLALFPCRSLSKPLLLASDKLKQWWRRPGNIAHILLNEGQVSYQRSCYQLGYCVCVGDHYYRITFCATLLFMYTRINSIVTAYIYAWHGDWLDWPPRSVSVPPRRFSGSGALTVHSWAAGWGRQQRAPSPLCDFAALCSEEWKRCNLICFVDC